MIKVFLNLLMGYICLCLNLAHAQSKTDFPLKLSANKRYLIDNKRKPFLIREISAWGLIQALSEKEASEFMDSVKRKGFNTMLVSIISSDKRFAGGPPDWQGISPFKVQWDFSTPDPAYFEHVDRVLQLASAKGMLVLLVPCYLGYKTDSTQGWWSKVLSPNNSPEKSRLYGEFIGKRYRNQRNIIWVAGGDHKGDGKLHPHLDNIIRGIKKFDDVHLWTGHFDSTGGGNWSADNELYSKYMDINGLYVFDEKNMGPHGPQYKSELLRYGKGKMIFQLDQSYEKDIPHGPDNEDYQYIRRKNYGGLLSGCAGTSFSPGYKDHQLYVFKNWRPLMNTEGMKQMELCFKLFTSRSWHLLEPDTSAHVIVSNRGPFGDIGYICAAAASDQSTYIAYLPNGGSIKLNLRALRMKNIKAWWYNPRTGEDTHIGRFRSSEQVKAFTCPTNDDWVLVIDNEKY